MRFLASEAGTAAVRDVVQTFLSDELHSFMSHAQGASYLLGWEKRPFVNDRSVLHGIASALAGRMGEL